VQLREVLSQNSSLTSLDLSCADPEVTCRIFVGLCDPLDNLRSLSLGMKNPDWLSSLTVPWFSSPTVPECIVNLKCLTCLRLRHGFCVTNLNQVVPHLPQLQSLQLDRVYALHDMPFLASLTALQTLGVVNCSMLSALNYHPPCTAVTRFFQMQAA
jgi:hypothetical protein